MHHDRSRLPHATLLVALSAVLGLCASCASAAADGRAPAAAQSDAGAAAGPDAAQPAEPPLDLASAPLGYFLAEMDGRVRAWTNLKLAPRGDLDQRKLRLLEQEFQRLSSTRLQELVEQVGSGPSTNRAVAAMLLGFSASPEAQAPLLAALSDSDQTVVNNALVGIGLLAQADTPTSQIGYLLRTHPEGSTRNNAAYSLARLAAVAGAEIVGADDVRETCRSALIDNEPGVRVQCASVLGVLADVESVQALSDLIFDPTNLVASAAGQALGEIGRRSPEHKGTCARALVTGMERTRAGRREMCRVALVNLSGGDLGDDVEPWKEWAYRMP